MEEPYLVRTQWVSLALIVRLLSVWPGSPIPAFGRREGSATPAPEVGGRGFGCTKRLGSSLSARAARRCRSP